MGGVSARVAVLICLLAGLLVAPPAVAATLPTCAVAAHRGDHARWTENSLNAYKAALADGADYLEMDVQVTTDGHFVLMHDETVDRTTRGRSHGTLRSRSYRQVRRLRLNDGRRVPQLSQVLDLARPTAARVFVELKWIPRSRWPSLVRLLTAFGTDRVVVNSFSPPVLLQFKADNPTIPTAADLERPVPVARARTYGAVLVDYRHLTTRWIRRMNAAGVPIYAWTVDSEKLWQRYRGRIDVILTNRVPAYVAFRRAHCAS